ncbi:MAG: carbohydrate ABC transporter substrate-binding protein, partial [Bdellovibrionota bacterium]|nr:carbohydrate ABC transporter substrate-binding protein [Bdellovibrionota bacterium]
MKAFHLLKSFRKTFSLIGFISLFTLGLGTAAASQTDFEKKALKKAKDLIKEEFKDSTLSKTDQLKELEWFIKASKPFRG